MSSAAKPIEDQLRDAAYTAIGVGIIAYRFSKPYRDRAEAVVRGLDDDLAPCLHRLKHQE